MNSDATKAPAAFPWQECLLVSAAGLLVTLWWIYRNGSGTFGWDELNHHIYLGRQALEGSRLQWDYFGASGQSCQYPQGYAPMVAMLDAGWSGMAMFMALGAISALAVPACWLIAWSMVPGRGAASAQLRITTTVLAFCSAIWWPFLLQTSNDLMSTMLGLWSIALALVCVAGGDGKGVTKPGARTAIYALAGAFAGVAFLVKLTLALAGVGAIAVVLMADDSLGVRLKNTAVFCLAGVAAFLALGGGWWAWESWRACGSPVYPFMVDTFRGLLPQGLAQ
jgi:hypothetical protein